MKDYDPQKRDREPSNIMMQKALADAGVLENG
jgi:hypothetical protein